MKDIWSSRRKRFISMLACASRHDKCILACCQLSNYLFTCQHAFLPVFDKILTDIQPKLVNFNVRFLEKTTLSSELWFIKKLHNSKTFLWIFLCYNRPLSISALRTEKDKNDTHYWARF